MDARRRRRIVAWAAVCAAAFAPAVRRWCPGCLGCCGSGFSGYECSTTASRFALVLRSEEHTSELQSLMRISYAVFCLKKKKNQSLLKTITTQQSYSN